MWRAEGLCVVLLVLASGGGACNIERRALPEGEFPLPRVPVVYTRPSADGGSPERRGGTGEAETALTALAARTARHALVSHHGHEGVVVAGSNRYSRQKVHMTLEEYVLGFEALNEALTPTDTPASWNNSSSSSSSSSSATERLYLFGDNQGPLWESLAEQYPFPPCQHCQAAGLATFGLGGRMSGVTFHTHGPGFAEVLHGRKQWFLYAPDEPGGVPGLGDDVTMEAWAAAHNPPAHTTHIGGEGLYECEIVPGELLYFPNHWEHGTLNTGDYNVFVSLFLDFSFYVDDDNGDGGVDGGDL